MIETISLHGQVELINESLVLRIPLAGGGDKLAPFARRIGKIEGDYLVVIIQPWLAEKLHIGPGSFVFVDNNNGKFTITRSARNDQTTN